jgi:hypothetical protein
MQHKALNLLNRFKQIIYCGCVAVKLTGTFFIMKQKREEHLLVEDIK